MNYYRVVRSKLAKVYGRLRDVHEQLACVSYRIWKPAVIFDVGANTGSSFAELVPLMSRARFYGFEPTPELAEYIQKRFARYPNYRLVRKAVAESSGTTVFNVADRNHGGCSSLLEFAENLQSTWQGRDDLIVTRRIEVEVTRLDQFIEENSITRIDFLHVDTQGTDVAVLRSLGAQLSIVQAGVIEVPQSTEVMLYKNQHSREEAVEFLLKHGFTIYKIDSQQNEDNLYFRR